MPPAGGQRATSSETSEPAAVEVTETPHATLRRRSIRFLPACFPYASPRVFRFSCRSRKPLILLEPTIGIELFMTPGSPPLEENGAQRGRVMAGIGMVLRARD
jgi:hypothetical protein